MSTVPTVRELLVNVKNARATASPEERAHPEIQEKFLADVVAGYTITDVAVDAYDETIKKVTCSATVNVDTAALLQTMRTYPYARPDQIYLYSKVLATILAMGKDHARRRYIIQPTSSGFYVTLLN